MSAFSPRPSTAAPSPALSSATFGPGASGSNMNPANAPHANSLAPRGHAPPLRTSSALSQQSRRSAGGPGSEPPHIIDGPAGRILCIADVRGNLNTLNTLAAEHDAQAIIHTGDFGFYNRESLDRISDRTLRHLVQYSTLIPQDLRASLLSADPVRGPPTGAAATASNMRAQIVASPTPLLSEFPLLLQGKLKLDVPVFTVWGACEDVAILERFRTGEYQVPNLQVLDEATTRAVEVGGVRLRLFGLGGAVVLHKLFDNGDGAATIAGGQGTMWTTVLQIGELIDTAQKSYDPTETRVLITHASPGREGLLAQLALALKADLTISAGLHFRYCVSYNEFSVQHDTQNYRNKLVNAKNSFDEVWGTVKAQVEEVIDDQQRILLNHALAVTNRVPPVATATGAASEELSWKNTWNWNLPDAAYGSLILDVKEGRVSAETRSQGFNFAYRKSNQMAPGSMAATPTGTPAAAPATARIPPSASSTTTPQQSHRSAVSPAPGATPAAPAGGKAAPTGPGVRPPPTGPSGVKSPPAGPKGQQGGNKQHQHQSSSASHHSRGAGSATEGAASPAGTPKPQTAAPAKAQKADAGASEWDTASPNSASKEAGEARVKPKRPRGGKKNKGSGLSSLSAAEGGETSGAEGLTSGNESGGGNAAPRKTSNLGPRQQKEQGNASGRADAAAPVTASGNERAAEKTPSQGEKPSASGAKSGDESGKETSGGASSGPGGSGSGSGSAGGRGGRGGHHKSRGGSGRGRGSRGNSRGGGSGTATASSDGPSGASGANGGSN